MTRHGLLALLGFALLSLAAASTGSFFRPGAWYEALAKPEWRPPNAAFPIVWTILYTAMAIAAWLVWRAEGWRTALTVYAIHMVLNALWTVLFFGLHRIGLALAELVVLWCAILLTTVLFFRAAPLAGWLMLPYLAWVSLAVALNAAIWRLNAAPPG